MPPRCLRSKLKSKVAHNCVVSLTLTLPGARCSKKHIDQDLLGCKFLELWIHPRKWTSCYLLFGGSGDRVNIDQLLGWRTAAPITNDDSFWFMTSTSWLEHQHDLYLYRFGYRKIELESTAHSPAMQHLCMYVCPGCRESSNHSITQIYIVQLVPHPSSACVKATPSSPSDWDVIGVRR